ncbi:MAG: SGNH/GDSL hydrolase family protein [Clostridia bacterium]|nr:SGNH/GDSL hydrolase family protein [Clostridia bacterium]
MKKKVLTVGQSQCIRAVSFLLILVTLLYAFSYVLQPRSNTRQGGMFNPNAHGFYGEPKNTMDMVILGNSDAYSGFSPIGLWNNFGYTSYISGEGKEHCAGAYRLLNEILTCQKPKVVLLETDMIFTANSKANQLEEIYRVTVESACPVFLYHDLWKRTRPKDIFKKATFDHRICEKGQKVSNAVNPPVREPKKLKEKTAIPVTEMLWLERIVSRCRQENIQLIFFQIPSLPSWDDSRHNTVQKFADKNSIPFLDLHKRSDEIGLDWQTDTRDRGNHLNNAGADKVTMWIGNYLKEQNLLTDHRDDRQYDFWNDDAKDFEKVVANFPPKIF